MSEKTEQPTAKRRRDARQKGQVFQSKEITSTALLLAVFAYMNVTWRGTFESLQELIVFPSQLYGIPFGDALSKLLDACTSTLIGITLPFIGLVCVVAIAAGYFQVGPLFVLKPMMPDLNKINPAQGIKKIFSLKNVLESLKSILKTVFLGVLIYILIRDAIPALVHIPHHGLAGVQSITTALFGQLATWTVFAYVAIAAADYFFERRQYIKGLMMSKDEVKREYKEMEGNPEIKHKRKQLHQQLINEDAVGKVRKSSVLVTNPTHLAVALYYKEDETPLPVVMAKGEGILARRMIEVAQEEGIPIMQNVPLAHDLFDRGQVNQYIPADLIEPIAEVLRWVADLKQS